MTAFIRISQPTYDSNFSFHPFSFFQILSLIKLKDFFLAQPTKEGRPKYCSYHWVIGTPRKLEIVVRVLWGVLELKKMLVLPLFIFWPDACSYSWRRDWIWTHLAIVALQNTKLSSTNSRCEIFGPVKRWVKIGSFHLFCSPMIIWRKMVIECFPSTPPKIIIFPNWG